jgi:hypothetical protein
MAIITTYVCDVSGKQSNDISEFVKVTISSRGHKKDGGNDYSGMTNEKFIHREVALKLNIIGVRKDLNEEAQPEVTFESKLTTLLKDYINDLVADEVSDQISHRS